MAIEIVDFPIKMVIFHGYVAVYQAGYLNRNADTKLDVIGIL